MNNINEKVRYARLTAYVLALAIISGLSAPAAGNESPDVSSQKRLLNSRLDSLEVEKQILKRSGKSLRELEERSHSLLDSLNQLRQKIAHAGQDSPQFSNSSPSGLNKSDSIFAPQGLFDWIIVVVGSMAVLSGLILIIGILRSFFKSSAKKPQKRVHQPTEEKVTPEPVLSTPSFETPDQQHPFDNKVAADPLLRLRKRLSEDNQRESTPAAHYKLPPSSFRLPEPNTLIEPDSDVDLQVVRAAQNGMEIPEISRRFHISADQVALILRVAQSRPKT